jgi:hypothetical protein
MMLNGKKLQTVKNTLVQIVIAHYSGREVRNNSLQVVFLHPKHGTGTRSIFRRYYQLTFSLCFGELFRLSAQVLVCTAPLRHIQ